VIIKDLGESPIANVIEAIDFEATDYDLGDTFLALPGVAGNYAWTADSPAISIVGDRDMRVHLAYDDWSIGATLQALMSQDNYPNDYAFLWYLLGDSRMVLSWTTGGTTATEILATSTATVESVVANGADVHLRTTIDVSNGSSVWEVKFFWSLDGIGWTQLGATVTGGVPTSLFDSSQTLKLGALHTGTSYPPTGKIYSAEIRNGIDGTVIASFNAIRAVLGADEVVSDQGELWMIEQAGTPPNVARIRFAGLLTGGNLVTTNLEGLSTVSFYNIDPSVPMYGAVEADSFYGQDVYTEMQYTTREVAIGQPMAGSTAVLVFTIEGVGTTIEFRNIGPNPIFGADADPFYGPDGDPFYETAPDWSIYTGPFVVELGVYQFRVTVNQGPVQPVIDHLVLTIDAPDLEDRLDNVAISAGGTRLPITAGKFTSIKNVQLTLQQDGGTGVTAEIIDKDTINGPLVRVFNVGHTGVTGLIDAVVKGY
jgi:hypothetical protein